MSYKVLHGVEEIAGNMNRICTHLRKAGVDATSVRYFDNWLGYKNDIEMHFENPIMEIGSEEYEKLVRFASEAIHKYDIFHFHFGTSLLQGFQDLETIKQAGKKIIFSFWGSDMRAPEWIMYQQFKFMGLHPPKPRFLNSDLLWSHKTINRYADVIIGYECIPRGLFVDGRIDPDEWTLEEKAKIIEENEVGFEKDPEYTYFLHSPSKTWTKGTAYFRDCWKEVEAAGIKAKMVELEHMETSEVRKWYAHADYVLEQIGAGYTGLFGLEMMCWEIPILAYQIPLFDKMLGNPPIIKITKENFVDMIKHCVATRERISGPGDLSSHKYLKNLKKTVRQWVLDHSTIQKAIPTYIDIYERLMAGEEIPQLINRGWLNEEHRIITTQRINAEGIQEEGRSLFYRWAIDQNFLPIGTQYDHSLYA